MQNKTAQEMMSFDFEAYTDSKSGFAQQQIANHQSILKASEQMNKILNDLLAVQTKSWSMEQLSTTPESVMHFASHQINETIKMEDLVVERDDNSWCLWYGDMLLREYKHGSNEIVCYFEKHNLPVNETIKRLMQ